VDTALEALSSIDSVTVSGSAGGPYTITFAGSHAGQNVAQLTGDATNLTKGSVDRTISYEFDTASQLTGVDDPAAEYDYTYDNLGRLITEVQDIAGLTPDIELVQTWNANSRRLSLAAEIGGTADFKNDYTYDNLSRMTQVIQQDVGGGNTVADKRVDFAYNALGQYTSLTRYQSTGTGTLVATSTYAYDTLNRLTDLDHKQNSTNLALYDYTYDFMDRITSMTHSLDGASAFTYDKESELTAADHASPRTDESYSFDATGNRTGGSYTNTTNNRTTADGTYTYDYDDEGNRSKRTKVSDGSYQEYAWDHRNRLTTVTFKNSSHTVLQTVDYAYDAFNRMVRRTHDSDGPGGSAATDQFFAYDGGSINPVLDFDGTSANDLAHRNLWSEALDQLLATEDVTNLGSAGNVLWPLADHQGTLRDIADLNEGSGVTSVTNHRTFDSFGNLTGETSPSVEYAFGFMGKPLDQTTGLIYCVNRWSDPFLGKWISADPIGFFGRDVNLSRYIANNSPNRSDPFGLEEMNNVWTAAPIGAQMELTGSVFSPMPTAGADAGVKISFATVKEVEDHLNKSPEAAKTLAELKNKGLTIVIDQTLKGEGTGNRARYDPYRNVIMLNNTTINTLSGATGYLFFEVVRAKHRAEQLALDTKVKTGEIKNPETYAEECEKLTFKYMVEFEKVAKAAMENQQWGPKGDIGYSALLATVDTEDEYIKWAKENGHYKIFLMSYQIIINNSKNK
jgi:RHS repeat-associated protein